MLITSHSPGLKQHKCLGKSTRTQDVGDVTPTESLCLFEEALNGLGPIYLVPMQGISPWREMKKQFRSHTANYPIYKNQHSCCDCWCKNIGGNTGVPITTAFTWSRWLSVLSMPTLYYHYYVWATFNGISTYSG